MEEIPDDLLLTIFADVLSIDFHATSRIALVSRRFHRLVSSPDFANLFPLSLSLGHGSPSIFHLPFSYAHDVFNNNYPKIPESIINRVSHVSGVPQGLITFWKVSICRIPLLGNLRDLDSLFPAVSHIDIDIQDLLPLHIIWPKSLKSFSIFEYFHDNLEQGLRVLPLHDNIICKKIIVKTVSHNFAEKNLFTIMETFQYAVHLRKIFSSEELPNVDVDMHCIWFSPCALDTSIPIQSYMNFMDVIQWNCLQELFISNCHWKDLENIFATQPFSKLQSLTIKALYTTNSTFSVHLFFLILEHIFNIQSLVHCSLDLTVYGGLYHSQSVPTILDNKKRLPIVRTSLLFLQTLHIKTERVDFLTAVLHILHNNIPPLLRKVSITASFSEESLVDILKVASNVSSLRLRHTRAKDADGVVWPLSFTTFSRLQILKLSGPEFLITDFPQTIQKLQLYRCKPFPWESIRNLHSLQSLELCVASEYYSCSSFFSKIQYRQKLIIPKEILEYIQATRCSFATATRLSTLKICGFFAEKESEQILRSLFPNGSLFHSTNHNHPIFQDSQHEYMLYCNVAIVLI